MSRLWPPRVPYPFRSLERVGRLKFSSAAGVFFPRVPARCRRAGGPHLGAKYTSKGWRGAPFLAFLARSGARPVALLPRSLLVGGWPTSPADPNVSELIIRGCPISRVFCEKWGLDRGKALAGLYAARTAILSTVQSLIRTDPISP